MARILGIGNAIVDVIIKLTDENVLRKFSLPKGSMQLVDNDLATKIEYETKGKDKQIASGGSAANTIHGLAKLGIEAGFIGKIGQDYYGEFFKNDMRSAGIKIHLDYGSSKTGRAITLVSQDSERTFATYLGSAVELNISDLDEELFKKFELLHIEGYLLQNHELVEAAFKIAKKLGLKISLDLSSYNVVEANINFLKENVSKYVDILFANEEEAMAYTGNSPEKAAEIIARDCDIAVVKTGKQGSLIQNGDDKYRVGIIQVNCIDTTGAGDLYAAGFLYGLSRGLHLEKCGKIGSLLAGKVIENLGAKISDITWLDINTLVADI